MEDVVFTKEQTILALKIANEFRNLMQDEINRPINYNCQHPFADLLIKCCELLKDEDVRKHKLYMEYK
jgi:hypothetical protein